ncbi:uncharacterized protein [Periplaneta americana]|uniref:uncharacterized protein n=1 Tax=Periplaneta americana TaxID=6978 RepID=UPI0037E7D4D4
MDGYIFLFLVIFWSALAYGQEDLTSAATVRPSTRPDVSTILLPESSSTVASTSGDAVTQQSTVFDENNIPELTTQETETVVTNATVQDKIADNSNRESVNGTSSAVQMRSLLGSGEIINSNTVQGIELVTKAQDLIPKEDKVEFFTLHILPEEVTENPKANDSALVEPTTPPSSVPCDTEPGFFKPQYPMYYCTKPGHFPAPPSCDEYHVCRLIGIWLIHFKETCHYGFEFSYKYKFCVPVYLSDCRSVSYPTDSGTNNNQTSTEDDSSSIEYIDDSRETGVSDESEILPRSMWIPLIQKLMRML